MSAAANTRNLENFWMPFTANRQFKQAPRLLESAHGMYYRDVEGNQVLDGDRGPVVRQCRSWPARDHRGGGAPAGKARLRALLPDGPSHRVSNSPSGWQQIAPGGAGAKLDRVFFAGSGSEAVDTALKIAIAYQRAIGQGTRTRLIGRERGYHGVGFGGISVGGLVNNRRVFPLLPGADHLSHTHDPARNAFSPGLPEHGAELADDLEKMVALHGAETIAAVIVEPVAGSTGVLLPPKGYLERLSAITKKYGILLIFDEVITGFGRLGTPFAVDYFGVVPDLVTTAKGLTNGAIPMGAVFASRDRP